LRPSRCPRSGPRSPRDDGQIGTSLRRTGALHDVECRDRTAKTLKLQVSEVLQPRYRFDRASDVAKMLRPGGSLYLADGHPAALVLDDAVAASDGTPGFYTPYFSGDPVIYCESEDYIVGETTFKNAITHTWIHPLGEIVTGLIEAGMRLDSLHEHYAVPWRMFRVLVRETQGLYRWPGKPWLPLAFSLSATRL
jgi:hypothetical protein